MSSTKQSLPLDAAEERSYFDGGFWGLLGRTLLANFVTSITLGIAFPWMYCWKQRWYAKHTVVCGKRTKFDGTGGQLIGKYLLWLLLTVITCGIYSWWMNIALKKWITKHTHYESEPDNNSFFDGGLGGYLGVRLLRFFATVLTLGIAAPWAEKKELEWEAKHTVIDSRRRVFIGTGGSLFLRRWLWGFLSAITLGIFALWIPIKMTKWTVAHTIDNEHTTDALIKGGEYRAGVQAQAAHLHSQRVQDEMEVIKAGITDSTDKVALLAMAEAGNRAAQYVYVQRYSEGDYTAAPFHGFLESAARQGYAPAMCAWGLSGLSGEETEAMLSGAARSGQLPAALQLMRIRAQQGLSAADDAAALPLLEEAIRWYDVLTAGEAALEQADNAAYTQCQMKLRRIRTKTPPRKVSVGKVIGIVALVLAGITVLALAIGAVAAYFFGAPLLPAISGDEYNFVSGLEDGYGVPEQAIGDSSYEDEFAYDSSAGMVVGPAAEEKATAAGVFAWPFRYFLNLFGAQEADGKTSVVYEDYEEIGEAETELGNGIEYGTFWDAYLPIMKDEFYYQIDASNAPEGSELYILTCNHYYWRSYFELTLGLGGKGINRIVLTGPRVYETIDENINALEFQSNARALYQALGIGDMLEIDPDITSGADYTVEYPFWSFRYTHTDSQLTLEITAR